MGRLIANKVRGMNWMSKISLILIFTLVFSTFMYQGLWKPKQVQAAIAFGSAGAVAAGTTALSVAYPASIAAGDLLVLGIANKYPANGPSTPSGWTLVTNGQGSGGAGVAGADSGTVYSTVYVKVADGTETGNLAVTLTAANSAMGRMFRYTKAAGTSWSYAATNGSDNTAGNAWSVTGAANPGITSGDMLVVVSAINGNVITGFASETVTATGATITFSTEQQDTGTNQGDDSWFNVSDFNVTAGTASAAPVFTMTGTGAAGNNPAGASVILRLRELPAGSLQFTSGTFSVNENVASVNLTVSRTGGSAGAVSVECADAGTGSATSGGTDYTFTTPQTLNWADGDTANKNCTVTINNDALDETNETVNALLQNVSGGATIGAQSTAQLTINDDDPTPGLSINDVSQVEGNSGTTTFTFTVTLSAASGQTVTVNYATADGTATTADSDYVAIGSTLLTFNPGDTTKTINVTVNGDTNVEPDETFNVNLSGASNATIADNQGVGTITNDDVPNIAPTLSVSQPDGTGDTVTVGASYNVTYSLADTDNVVTAAFYYDTDNTGLNGTAITGACAAAAEGSGVTCSWDTTGMTPGSYYVYGITNDGVNPQVSAYSPGMITINPATNPLLHNSINTVSTKWSPNGWGITGGRYDEFTCETCHQKNTLNNIKRVKDTITAPTSPTLDFPGGANSPVSFLATSGANSFGDDSGNTPRASSTKICEVCHTYDATQTNGVNAHPYSVGVALPDHYSADGTDCITCHKHSVGFKKMACDTCHGNPPTTAGLGGPTGLANDPGPTGSTTAGAHNTHVTTLSFACGNCHYGYSMPETPQTIDIGFNMWTRTGTGTTYGAANEVTVADAYRGTNGTTILTDNSRNCANLYCHGSFTGGLNATPKWTDATAACGTCHASDAASASSLNNSHSRHAGSAAGGLSVACADCHNNGVAYALKNGHVNGKIAWSLKTADSRFGGSAVYSTGASGEINNVAPSAGYQTCATLYCHSNVQNTLGTAGPASYGTPTWGGGALTCSEAAGCHNNPPATGKHATHVTTLSYTCSTCHNGAGDETVSHANNLIDMSINATYSGTYSQGSHAPGSGGFGTCNTVYCHGNYTGSGGTGLNPAWDGTAACGSCHLATQAAPPTTNAHVRHTGTNTASGQLNLACTKCHGTNGSGAAGHVDLSVQWGLDTADAKFGGSATYRTTASGGTAAKAPSGTMGSCESVYCHSSVQNNGGNAGPSSYVTQLWQSATVACDSCHGQGTHTNGQPSTGSHELHVTTSGLSCSTCHNNAGSGTALHANRTIDMSLSAGGSYVQGSHTPGTGGYSTCSTTNCHGTSSPTWGANTSYATCVKCHGVATSLPADFTADNNRAAPGYTAGSAPVGPGVDTGGSSLATDAQVGAHDTHLRALSLYSDPVACTECHSNVTGSVSFTGHMDGSGTLSWGTLATTGSSPATYSSVTGTCSNTYCHGEKQTGGTYTDKAPEWNQTGYLTGTRADNGDCGKCHGAPPQTAAHVKAAGPIYYAISECIGCHDHVNTDGTFTAGVKRSKHINGTVDGGGCSGCHAYDATGSSFDGTTWTGGTWGTGVYRDGLTPGEGWGAHAKHINHLKTRLGYNTTTKILAESAFGTGDAAVICGTCHTNTGAHTTGGLTTGRLINFGDGSTTYKFGPSNPLYNGVSGTSSATTAKTCSNISCHFSTTPVWSSY